MLFIKSKQDILENLQTIRGYLNGNEEDKSFAKSLIARGRCFVAWESTNEIPCLFVPSRFVGYEKNSRQDHKFNDEKDGKETNPAIIELLGPLISEKNPDSVGGRDFRNLEDLYCQLCRSLNVKPSKHKRSYWNF